MTRRHASGTVTVVPANAPGPRAPSRDALSWISLGVVAAACVLWLAFGRTDAVAAEVFGVRPGGRYRDVLEPMRILLEIRGGGVLLAWGFLVGALLLRKEPLDGRSPAAWLNLVATLATVLGMMLIARDLRGRPVSADLWIVFAGIAAAPVGAFWRARRRSEATAEPR